MKRAGIIVFLLCVLSLPALGEDFYGYPCTQDCSGHNAGYEWAERNGITEASECGGNSNSFIEGCYAWAEQQNDTAQDEDRDDTQDSSEEQDE